MPTMPDHVAEEMQLVRMGPFAQAVLTAWGRVGQDDVVCTVGPRPTFAERECLGAPGRRAAFRDNVPEEPLVEGAGRPTSQFDQTLTPAGPREGAP